MAETGSTSLVRVPFSLLTKPTGAACNLDCSYCFFLSKEVLWGGDSQRICQGLAASHRVVDLREPAGEHRSAQQGPMRPGAGGGVSNNVNRWRQQLGLAPLPDTAMVMYGSDSLRKCTGLK